MFSNAEIVFNIRDVLGRFSAAFYPVKLDLKKKTSFIKPFTSTKAEGK